MLARNGISEWPTVDGFSDPKAGTMWRGQGCLNRQHNQAGHVARQKDIAQWLEHKHMELTVVGSIPTILTKGKFPLVNRDGRLPVASDSNLKEGPI